MGKCASTPKYAQDEGVVEAQDVNEGLILHEGSVSCIVPAWNSNDTFLTAGDDGKVVAFNWKTNETIFSWSPHERSIQCVASGDTQDVFTCGRDGIVCHLRKDKAEPVQKFEQHELTATAVAIDSTQMVLCSGGRDNRVCLWDISTGKCLQYNKTPRNLVTCLKWIPQEPLIVQGSEDLRVRVWDSRQTPLSPVHTYDGYIYFPLALDISPDGYYILTSSKGFDGVGCEGRIWDRRMNKLLGEYVGHTQDATACSFLPNITDSAVPVPATASKDGTIRIWDPETRETTIDHLEMGASNMFTHLSVNSENTIYASSFTGQVFCFAVDLNAKKLMRLPKS